MPTRTLFGGRLQPKPLEKCLGQPYLLEWVDEEKRGRITVEDAWKIIKIHFCGAVVGRGVCPIDCERCKLEIIDLFRLEAADSPKALLTWLAKDHSARWIEKLIGLQHQQDQTPEFPAQETPDQAFQNLFASPGEENIFEELHRQYASET